MLFWWFYLGFLSESLDVLVVVLLQLGYICMICEEVHGAASFW